VVAAPAPHRAGRRGRDSPRAARGRPLVRAWGRRQRVRLGRVLVRAPPGRLVFTWQINACWQFDPDPDHDSEIEVLLSEDGPGQTRVEVEHRHFDRLVNGRSVHDAIRGGGATRRPRCEMQRTRWRRRGRRRSGPSCRSGPRAGGPAGYRRFAAEAALSDRCRSSRPRPLPPTGRGRPGHVPHVCATDRPCQVPVGDRFPGARPAPTPASTTPPRRP
jgi:Activator of Hsp90 ATPase homolog 1-like protein